jgi:hypothetical protein
VVILTVDRCFDFEDGTGEEFQSLQTMMMMMMMMTTMTMTNM